MKKFIKEFKAFISRGNVMDMAVGIIVGGAFTAIITSVVNNLLTPLIHAIPGTDNTSALKLVLREAVYDETTGNVLREAIIMDFGAVISAIVSFLITAFVLFLIIKAFNKVREGGKAIAEKQRKKIEKQLKKGKITKEEAEKKEAEAEVKAVAAPPAPTTEQLLAEIRDLLKAQKEGEAATDAEKK